MKKIRLILILSLILATLVSCSGDTDTEEKMERVVGETADYSGSDYITVAEGENVDLLLQPSTGNIRWMDRTTGEYFETKLYDSGSSDTTMLSDVIVSFYSGAASNKYSTSQSMDSYTYGVETDSLTYEYMENGVRFVYILSSDSISYKDLPAYISEERMEEYIFQYLDASQKEIVLKQYRQLSSGIYARVSSKEYPVSGMALKELYNLFYEVGSYTYEELTYDYDEYDVAEDERTTNQSIEMTVEYYLDGDDLVVRIPTGEMVYNDSEYPLKSIDVLPFFLSSAEDDGYMFVPDGSGALIYLDNDKTQEYQFSARYYGGDILQGNSYYKTNDISMNLPVYGIKSGDKSVLGIIESGSEVATLKAYTSGYDSSNSYSRLSLSFDIQENQVISDYSTSNYTQREVSDDIYTGDIQIKYVFLSGDDASYVGMAKAYQNYLVENDALAENEQEEEAALFVELLGATDSTEYFLGVPYEGTLNLTTFEEAKTILGELSGQGILNIMVEYSGMVNGGLNQRSAKKISLVSSLGGSGAFQSLTDYIEEIGAKLYPNILLQTATTTKNLSKDEQAYTIQNKAAHIYDQEIVTGKDRTDDEYAKYIIAPTVLPDFINTFLKSYSKLGVSNVASSDLLSFISPNYRKNQNMNMANAASYYEEALNSFSDDYNLMLSNPVSLGYSIASYITDLPTESSKLKILDAEVPFVQLVLDGYITYSSEKLNTNSYDIAEEFLKAIETRSALKFTLTATDTIMLQDTKQNDVFMTQYSGWIERIGEYYNEYNAFYQKVKDAQIVEHEIVGRNVDTIKITYSNNVIVYINYSDEDTNIDGVNVSANSYTIREG